MNQVAYYPRDTLTFAREPKLVKTQVIRWSQPDPVDLAGLEVLELSGSEAWAAWDLAVSEQDKRNA